MNPHDERPESSAKHEARSSARRASSPGALARWIATPLVLLALVAMGLWLGPIRIELDPPRNDLDRASQLQSLRSEPAPPSRPETRVAVSSPTLDTASIGTVAAVTDTRTFHEGGPVGLFSLKGDARDRDRAYCDEANWSRMSLVEEVGEGRVYVAQKSWIGLTTGTRAQLAGWMSRCTQSGRGVEILSAESNTLLATYSREDGLSLR